VRKAKIQGRRIADVNPRYRRLIIPAALVILLLIVVVAALAK
jgi:hypothetical protein